MRLKLKLYGTGTMVWPKSMQFIVALIVKRC